MENLINTIDIEYVKMIISLYFFYAFAGWIMETTRVSIKTKKFVNRGFMIGPVIPIYGWGVILITLCLSSFKNNVLVLFLLSFFLCGFVEYFVSFLMEKLFKARWWDYSNRKFNLNGRVCLENLILFGIAGIVVIEVFNPIIYDLYYMIPKNIIDILLIIVGIIYVIDSIVSIIIMYSFKGTVYGEKDNTEQLSQMAKEKVEDKIDEVEANTKHTIRRISVKTKRKIRYTRNNTEKSIKEIRDRIDSNRNALKEKVTERTDNIRYTIKEKKLEIEYTGEKAKEEIIDKIIDVKGIVKNRMNTIKMTSEEFTNNIKEKFKAKGFLQRRLIEAFPNMQVKVKGNNSKRSKNK